jgi:hypothetical protein
MVTLGNERRSAVAGSSVAASAATERPEALPSRVQRRREDGTRSGPVNRKRVERERGAPVAFPRPLCYRRPLSELGWIERAAGRITLVGDGGFPYPLIQALLARRRMEELRAALAEGRA